jgi:hypothetical protein
MTNNEIIQEAIQRGYLRASRIRPAHLSTMVTEHHPVLLIPEGADLYFRDERGDLYLRHNFSVSFKDAETSIKWGGVVYNRQENRWAEIVAYHSVSLPKQSLRDFPSSGVCWDFDESLVKYITRRKDTHVNANLNVKGYKGIAWNSKGSWAVLGYSNQTEYRLAELKPFLPKPHEVALTPLTSEECFLPPKWYINVNSENIMLVNDFLLWKKDEYVRYHTSWHPHIGCTFFYPQASPGSYGGSDTVVPPGYTKITTEALVSHVLKHKQLNDNLNNKENERQENKGDSIKVQRSNLIIRESEPIRASGVKCAESKIQVRNGYSPD